MGADRKKQGNKFRANLETFVSWHTACLTGNYLTGRARLWCNERMVTDLTLEADVARPMVEWLRAHNVEVFQQRRDRRASTRSGGWPDLTFCIAGTPFAIEVKRPGRRSGTAEHRARQRACQERLRANGWKVSECESVTELCDFIQNSLPVTILWA
jgi:hypothetical protein